MELITLTEAAQRANVTPRALRQAASEGRLQAVKLGRDWFVHANEVDRYVRERRTWHGKQTTA